MPDERKYCDSNEDLNCRCNRCLRKFLQLVGKLNDGKQYCHVVSPHLVSFEAPNEHIHKRCHGGGGDQACGEIGLQPNCKAQQCRHDHLHVSNNKHYVGIRLYRSCGGRCQYSALERCVLASGVQGYGAGMLVESSITPSSHLRVSVSIGIGPFS